jgi:hypothetical protein
MKALLPALLAAASAASPVSAAERNFSVPSFERIRVDGPYKVSLKTGVAPFAVASGSAEAIDAVSIGVEGQTLIIRKNPSSFGGYPGKAPGPVEIEVGTHDLFGTHDLSTAWLNGSGSLAIDRVRGLSFDLAVQGSGSASIGNTDVDQFKVGISGAGNATVAGKAPRLTAIVRGTSKLDAGALTAKDALIGVEGPSDVRVIATATAKIEARGASTVEIGGNPACTVKAEGSATVTGCQ